MHLCRQCTKGKHVLDVKGAFLLCVLFWRKFSHFNTVYYNLLAWHSRLLEQVGTHLCYLFVLAHSKYLEAHSPGSHLIIAFCRVWLKSCEPQTSTLLPTGNPSLESSLLLHSITQHHEMFQSMSTRLPPGVWQQLNRADVHCDGSVSCWKLGANVFLHG